MMPTTSLLYIIMGCMFFWVKFGSAFAYFVVFVFTSQMALLLNINNQTEYILIKIKLCLIVPGRHRKYIFTQESFYLQVILDDINEQDIFF